MITVRELECQLNVSRVSLYAILKKDPFKNHVVRGKKNVMMVNNEGADMLREYYSSKIRGGTPRNDKPLTNGSAEQGAISILQAQLAKKDEQIDSLLNIVSKNGIAY